MGISLIVALEMVHAETLWPFKWVGEKVLFCIYFMVKKIKS